MGWSVSGEPYLVRNERRDWRVAPSKGALRAMLRSVNSLIGHRLLATDGELGTVKDLYFDDRAWAVRYFVVNTGGWLADRRVLISPIDVGEPDWSKMTLPVGMSREQVEASPPAEEDKPVSRQYEENLSAFFGWPFYWVTTPGGVPAQAGTAVADQVPEHPDESDDSDPHLRSANEVIGYQIQASDDEIGHVETLIADTDLWVVRYLVVDTRNWFPGRKVLVARNWLKSVSWKDRKVVINLTCEEIKGSPEYDEAEPVNRRYEERLYDYYGRPTYWN
jgi:uncharacterized protein YrrD